MPCTFLFHLAIRLEIVLSVHFSDHISIRMKMKMSKLEESLPKVLFNSTPFDSKDPKGKVTNFSLSSDNCCLLITVKSIL